MADAPATPDYAGALKAGYSPTEILDAMGPSQKGGPDIAGARAAGYSDQEILQGLTGDSVSSAASPPPSAAASSSQPGHGLGSALASGFESAKGDLEQGLADAETAGQKYLGHGLIGKIETNPKEAAVNFLLGPFSPYADTKNTADPDAALTPALERGAQAARTSAAQTYQPDASTPTSAADAIANSSGPLSAAARLGKYALYQGAQAAPTLGANLLMTAAAPESTLARIGLVGLNGLSNLGGVSATKQGAGLDPNDVSLGDLANAGVQTAMMGMAPARIGGGVLGKVLTPLVDGAAKGAAQPALNDIGAVLQGGNLGNDPTAVAERIGGDMLNGAVGGAVVAPGIEAARSSVQAISDFRNTRQAGSDMQAYNAETGPHQRVFAQAMQQAQEANPGMAPEDIQAEAARQVNQAGQQAVNQAAQQIQQANPQMAPEEAQNQAQAQVRAQGLLPTPFDQLSPEAQNGAAQMAAIEFYDKRLQTMTTGSGTTSQPRPDQVFKGVLDDVSQNLRKLSSQLQGNGLLDRDQAQTLNAAIAEGAKHNRIAGENGNQFGYFDTLRDQVAALPLDDGMKSQILQHLKVLDIASQASLQRNNKGPLERNARWIGPIAASIGTGILSNAVGLEGLGTEGLGIIGEHLVQGSIRRGLRGLDQLNGAQLPDVLRKRAAIEQFSQKNGLSPIADPAALASMIRDLSSGANAPSGTPPDPTAGPRGPVPSPPAGMPLQSPTGPGSGNGQGYTAQPLQGPAESPQTPEMGGSPQGGGNAPLSPVQGAPSGPTIGPVTAADRLAVALSHSAPPIPVQAPTQRPQAVGPASLAQAMASVQQALDARQARLGAQARAAFPADGQNWSGPMADMLGVQHGPMMEALRATAAKQAPELLDVMSKDNIPPDVYGALTNHVRTLRDAGYLPLNAAHSGPSSGIANPISYAANVRQAEATADAIRQNHPRLADLVGSVVSIKTKQGRGRAIEAYLGSLPEPQRTLDRAILGPLARYGAGGE